MQKYQQNYVIIMKLYRVYNAKLPKRTASHCMKILKFIWGQLQISHSNIHSNTHHLLRVLHSRPFMASALALSPTLLPLSRHRRSIFSPAAQIPLLSSIPRPHLLRGIVSLPLVPSGRVLWRVRAESTKQEREPMVPPFNVLITGSTKGTSQLIIYLYIHHHYLHCFA